MSGENELETETDIILTSEIYKSMGYDDKVKFLKSQDSTVFFRKIKFSPLYKSLPIHTARIIDMLAGMGSTVPQNTGSVEEQPAIFEDKRIPSNQVENMVQSSVNDPLDYWTKESELMRVFKASGESIAAALRDAVEDGRISKSHNGHQTVYASC